MNEAMLSYFNRIRVAAYPDMTAVAATAQYGDLPFNPAWGSGSPGWKGFDPAVFPTGRLTAAGNGVGWVELFGVKSVAPSGMDANMQKVGHQQSPGNVEQMAPGRMGAPPGGWGR